MSRRTCHGCYWFISGIVGAIIILVFLRARDVAELSGAETFALLVLGVLSTVQFGVIIPITCIVFRYKAEEYNFYHALLLLIGFTVGSGVIVALNGAVMLAVLYVIVSSLLLAAFYKITYILHRHLLERPKRREP